MKTGFVTAVLIASLMPFAFVQPVAAQPVTGSDVDILEVYQRNLREVAKVTLPVVVEIEVIERVSVPVRNIPSPFEFFFGTPDTQTPKGTEPRQYEQRGIGSGIIVRKDGNTVYVLTNNHVAGGADRISLRLYDGREYDAELVGSDANKDLALIKFQTDEVVPVAVLGNSDDVQVGDLVMAVGNPLGFESTVTSGMVSAVGREAPRQNGMPLLTDYIQTDAAINQGNSGGALVNIHGEVIGINTWIASQTGGSIGLGFAIPVNNARRAIEQFISSGRVEYGWLGGNMANPPASPSDSLKESEGGAFVYSVFRGSPADEAGILPGDIIVRVNGSPIHTGNDLLHAVSELEPGTRNRFSVNRYGRSQIVVVETGSRPDEGSSGDTLWPGLSVVEITDEIRRNMDLNSRSGDLIIGQVSPASPAATAGLQPGDIITRVNNESTESLLDFYRAINESADDEIVFRIRRNSTNLIIGLVK